jgi:hypothetical protein
VQHAALVLQFHFIEPLVVIRSLAPASPLLRMTSGDTLSWFIA